MHVAPEVFADADALGSAAADLVLDRLGTHPPGRAFLLGCPGGRSARSTYEALGRRAAADQLDLSRVVIVMMDEYVLGSRGAFAPVEPTAPHSCRRFGEREIIGLINAGVPEPHRIPSDHLWVPDPAAPDEYERRLEAAGGIDVFLLASGTGDGHVAFNPPGAAPDSRTRVVALPDSTRLDNLATFPSFGNDLDRVPLHGVSVGIATIRDRSAEVIMLVHGPDKRPAAERLTAATAYDPTWPATILADCRRPHLFLDRAAAPATEPPSPLTKEIT